MLTGLLGGAGGPSGECGARLTRLAAPLASAAPAQSGPALRGAAGGGGTATTTSTPYRRGNCDDASARSTRSTCRWSLSGAYPAPSPVPPRARPPERAGAASGTHAEHATALACCAARTGGAAPPPVIEARAELGIYPSTHPPNPTRPRAPTRAPPRHATREAAPMQRSGLSLTDHPPNARSARPA